jgi:hypothetical protein
LKKGTDESIYFQRIGAPSGKEVSADAVWKHLNSIIAEEGFREQGEARAVNYFKEVMEEFGLK